jgi:MarR family transcriptional regulator, lower aerobic nicotinate degradation pathway regulator
MKNTAPKKPRERPSRSSPSLTSVGFLLHRAQSRLREAVTEAIARTRLQPGHLAVLGVLADRGGMSQRMLGELAQIEKSSMVLYLDILEADGWIRREPEPSDRRAHNVQLTAEGAKKFAALGPSLLAAQRRFLEPLRIAEVDALTEMLTRLGGSLEVGTESSGGGGRASTRKGKG